MKKIIFLDVDGVLNTSSSLQSDESVSICRFNKESLDTLEDVVKRTGAKIVLTTTWRRFFKDNMVIWNHSAPRNKTNGIEHLCNADALVQELSSRGIELIGKIKSTKDSKSDWARGFQILEYVKENNIQNYVILDDGDVVGRSSVGEEIRNNFVQTTFDEGLNKNHIEKIINIILKEEK